MEDVGELIGKGFSIWRSNLNLGLPYVLNLLASVLLMMPILAVMISYLGPIQDLETLSSEELMIRVQEALPQLSLAFILAVLLLVLVSSFFTAGAVGMARQAVETGKTTTSAMWSSGKAHLWNMFGASVLMGLITLAGIVFLLPGASLLIPQYQDPDSQTLGIFVAGMVLLIIYALIVSLLFAAVPFALVVGELGPVDALKAGISFFGYNKFDVFLLWLIVLAMSIGLQMIGGSTSTNAESPSFQPISVVTGLLNLLVLAPLSTVWWTRLYLSRTGKLMKEDKLD